MITREQIAIVTGASSGLGAEFARQLAGRGWPVLAVARRADRLADLAAEVRRAGGAPVHPLSADLTDPEAAERVARHAAALGPIDWLVNNAGIVRVGPFAGSDLSAHVDQIEINCTATVRLTAALLPAMIAHKRGIILNVGSLSGFQPTPGFAIYGAAKAFVLSFSEALREELQGTGVQVSVLCTPPVVTEIFDAGLPAGVPRGRMFGEITPDVCVRAALAGAERRRTLVFVKTRDRVLPASAKFSPRAIVRRVSRLISLRYLGLPPLGRMPPWRSERR